MKYWALCCLLFLSVSSIAQKSDLPKKVAKAFNDKYPGIENLKWNVENGDYKIKFSQNGKKTTVEIDGDGTWEKTSIHILFEELPAAVQKTVLEHQVNLEINEIKKVVNDEDELYYRVDLTGENKILKLWIDDKGAMMKSETDMDNE